MGVTRHSLSLITLALVVGGASSVASATLEVFSVGGPEAATKSLGDDTRARRQWLDVAADTAVESRDQWFEGARVLGARVTVFSDPATGDVERVVGFRYHDLAASNAVRLDADAALQIVAERIGKEGDWGVELIFDPEAGRFLFNVENRRSQSAWVHWIDAESGEVVDVFDSLATASGVGVLGDIKDLSGLTRPTVEVFEMVSQDGRQSTYDGRGGNALPGVIGMDKDDVWNTPGRSSPGQAALVDAQFHSRVADSYFRSRLGFDWLAHYAQGMVSTVHFQPAIPPNPGPPDNNCGNICYYAYNNAFWNGAQAVYGDGSAGIWLEFSGALDIVAHELAHGITSATNRLLYRNESGALNEAFSDIVGTGAEFFHGAANWQIADTIHYGAALRDLANPPALGHPSHYADRLLTADDNGGVHTNSGIANHWFYLLVSGGQNANPARRTGALVPGIGWRDAERILMQSFAALPETATFCLARVATLGVAGARYAAVTSAWDEVGVNTGLCGPDPIPPPPPDIELLGPAHEVVRPGGTFDIGIAPQGSSLNATLFIANRGEGSLGVTGVGVSGDGFSLPFPTPTLVAPGSEAGFTVRLRSTNPGSYVASLVVTSDDPDEGSYGIALTGRVAGPEIRVERTSGGILPDGASLAFPALQLPSPGVTTAVRICNDGDANLALSEPAAWVTGGGFSLATAPPSALVPAQCTLVSLSFAAATPGTYLGHLAIQSSDANESPFDLDLTATAHAAAMSEIRVQAGGVQLDDGALFAFPTTSLVTLPVTRSFDVCNDGTGPLTLTNPGSLVTGTGFSQSTPLPPSSIAPGACAPFTVRLSATAPGTYAGAVTLHSNDSDESPFDVVLRAVVTAASSEARLVLASSGGEIPDGGSFSFGSIRLGSASTSRLFLLCNDGDAPLSFLNPSSFVSGAAFALVDALPTSPIAAGQCTGFRVRFYAPSVGAHTGALTIQNNDANENPYNLALSGTVVP